MANPRGEKRRGSSSPVMKQGKTAKARRTKQDYSGEFIAASSEGIWCLEVDPPVDSSLPEDEQLEVFVRSACLAKCNDAMARMHGYKGSGEPLGAKMRDLLPLTNPVHLEQVRAFIRNHYRQSEFKFHRLDPQGRLRYYSVSAAGIVEDGRMLRVWGTQRDVTEGEPVDRGPAESEQLLRAILSASPMGIGLIKDRAICWANESLCRVSGYSGSELVGKDARVLYENDEEYKRVGERLYRVGQAETRYVRKDGSAVDVFVQISPAGHDAYILSVTDITRQKDTETALQESEAKY